MVLHPQFWPENADYANKRVVIIGSGATAVTLVPAMAKTAAHVTMLQRSPTYMIAVPEVDKAVIKMRRYLPENVIYRMIRARNVGVQAGFYAFAKAQPQLAKRFLLSQVKNKLGKHVDMTHFTPSYNPWDQRICALPKGDLFRVVTSGKASVVTDHIESFTASGIVLRSGKTLDADVVVTATGLDIKLFGGMSLAVDDQPFDYSKSMNYKGVMFEDLPNLGLIFGYTNASWTLKADITSEYICRLLNHMDKAHVRQCTPVNLDPSVVHADFLDFSSGYVQRALEKLPKSGSKAPWKLAQRYLVDLTTLRFRAIDDGILQFSNPV